MKVYTAYFKDGDNGTEESQLFKTKEDALNYFASKIKKHYADDKQDEAQIQVNEMMAFIEANGEYIEEDGERDLYRITEHELKMKLYVAVTKYNCYNFDGSKMYFQRVLGVFTTIEEAKKGLKNACDKLNKDLHPWTKWHVYEVEANSLNVDSFNFENRIDAVCYI